VLLYLRNVKAGLWLEGKVCGEAADSARSCVDEQAGTPSRGSLAHLTCLLDEPQSRGHFYFQM